MGKVKASLQAAHEAKRPKTARMPWAVDKHQAPTRPVAPSTARQTYGNIRLDVVKYCSCGKVFAQQFTPETLWLVKITCNERPNPVFKLRSWLTICFDANTIDSLKHYEDFEANLGCRHVWVGSQVADPDDVRFQKNSQGYYVSDSLLKDWLMVMDSAFFWRADFSNHEFEKLKVVPTLEIHVPEDCPLDVDAEEDDLKCTIRITREEIDKRIAFHLPPPNSSRIVVVEMVPKSDTIGEWILGGNT